MEVVGGAGAAEGVTRVLVVDDSPVDRRVAQLLLSSDSCASRHRCSSDLALVSYPCDSLARSHCQLV